jgi:putative tryptophan/tyrosine transport system substrate-binding protein
VRRREFIALLGGLAAAWPAGIDAQQRPKVARIGILDPSPAGVPSLDAFYQALHELGYTEGKNIVIARRYGEWRPDRFREAAAELVGLGVDVLVAFATPAARAAKQATGTIPIVAISMGDPVGDELVANLASPGGNVTGTTFLGPELVAKRFGLFKQAIPRSGCCPLASRCLWRTYNARFSK